MSFEEKMTWVSAVVTSLVTVVYFTIVLGDVGTVPVSEIRYQPVLLVAVGVTVVMMIVGAIIMAIATAIAAEVTGEGSVEDINKQDERDSDIGRRGDIIGYYVSSGGVVGVMGLAMLEYPQFWIANALYLSFAVGTIVASAVKLVIYRRGF